MGSYISFQSQQKLEYHCVDHRLTFRSIVVFAFFGAHSPGEVHYINCSLVSGVYQWIHVSSTVTKQHRNSFGLHLNSVWHCSEVVSLLCLSGVSKRGTHHANSFLMSKISCRIWPTWSFEVSTVSAILCTFNWQSANARLWIFSHYPPWQPFSGHLGVAHQKSTCDNHVETH